MSQTIKCSILGTINYTLTQRSGPSQGHTSGQHDISYQSTLNRLNYLATNSLKRSSQTQNCMLWDQQHHYTTLGVGQIANVHPYPSVHQPCSQTQSYSDHRRSMLRPKNGCINGAHVTSVARRGTLLILQIYWKMCPISVLLCWLDLNDARATSSLSAHCGFTWLTKSCVTNERCVPLSLLWSQ